MGIKYKVDGKYVNPSEEENGTSTGKIGYTNLDIEPAEIKMSQDMTERLWSVINENTELKQKLYFANHRLEQIKRLLQED